MCCHADCCHLLAEAGTPEACRSSLSLGQLWRQHLPPLGHCCAWPLRTPLSTALRNWAAPSASSCEPAGVRPGPTCAVLSAWQTQADTGQSVIQRIQLFICICSAWDGVWHTGLSPSRLLPVHVSGGDSRVSQPLRGGCSPTPAMAGLSGTTPLAAVGAMAQETRVPSGVCQGELPHC